MDLPGRCWKIFTASVIALSGAARADIIDGARFLQLCAVYNSAPLSAPSQGCAFYVRGAFDALQIMSDDFWVSVCVPDNFSTNTLTSTVLDYVRGNPSKRSDPIVILTMGALARAYPCRPGQHHPHKNP
jgi:hypothetical protein